VGSCDHVPPCQVLNVVTSRGLGAANAYPLPKALGRVDQTHGNAYPEEEGGGTGRQVAKSCMYTSIVRRKSEGVDCSQA
jgi:hypothetical protein